MTIETLNQRLHLYDKVFALFNTSIANQLMYSEIIIYSFQTNGLPIFIRLIHTQVLWKLF